MFFWPCASHTPTLSLSLHSSAQLCSACLMFQLPLVVLVVEIRHSNLMHWLLACWLVLNLTEREGDMVVVVGKGSYCLFHCKGLRDVGKGGTSTSPSLSNLVYVSMRPNPISESDCRRLVRVRGPPSKMGELLDACFARKDSGIRKSAGSDNRLLMSCCNQTFKNQQLKRHSFIFKLKSINLLRWVGDSFDAFWQVTSHRDLKLTKLPRIRHRNQCADVRAKHLQSN